MKHCRGRKWYGPVVAVAWLLVPLPALAQPAPNLPQLQVEPAQTPAASEDPPEEKTLAPIEEQLGFSPYKINYVMPYSYSVHPNYSAQHLQPGDLQHSEVAFQVSYKVLLWDNLLGHNFNLYFAYTNRSFWQAYNKNRSSPFRETNHEPEFFIRWHDPIKPIFADFAEYDIGLVHQSNGRSDPFSRSWNRIYLFPRFRTGNFSYGLKLWYRIPEDKKRFPTDAQGDDNPDILHYMGNFELHLGYRSGNHYYNLMLRNNLDGDNKGAVQLSYSFPIHNAVFGYIQYFDGYGESLIDYNHHNRRIGIGVAFNTWM